MYMMNLQILQQCILCENRRDKHNGDELPRAGLLIWNGIQLECDPKHILHLLQLPPKGDAADPTHSSPSPPPCGFFFFVFVDDGEIG